MKTGFFMLKKKRGKGRLVLALLLAPPLACLAYFLLLFLLDTGWGDGLMRHQYLFESRRKLVLQLVQDYGQALLTFYVFGLLLWAEIGLLARLVRNSHSISAMGGIFSGLVIAAILVGISLSSLLPAAVAGLLIAVLISQAMWPVSRRK